MEGEWVAGCRQGQGISLYSNGNIFEGEWEGDKVGRLGRERGCIVMATIYVETWPGQISSH